MCLQYGLASSLTSFITIEERDEQTRSPRTQHVDFEALARLEEVDALPYVPWQEKSEHELARDALEAERNKWRELRRFDRIGELLRIREPLPALQCQSVAKFRSTNARPRDTTESRRQELLFMVRIAESAERYDEMLRYMKAVVAEAALETVRPAGTLSTSLPALTSEEVKLLIVAYKNVVNVRRHTWRVLDDAIKKEERAVHSPAGIRPSSVDEVDVYRRLNKLYAKQAAVEEEIGSIASDVFSELDRLLPQTVWQRAAVDDTPQRGKTDEKMPLQLPHGIDAETAVLLLKMRADYNKYIAEYEQGEARQRAAAAARKAYGTALHLANRELEPTHPARLGVVLNMSVFLHEIEGNSEHAARLAKQTFDSAVSTLDTLCEDSYKDSTLILQLIRDNITLWESSGDAGNMPAEGDTAKPEPAPQQPAVGGNVARAANVDAPYGQWMPSVDTEVAMSGSTPPISDALIAMTNKVPPRVPPAAAPATTTAVSTSTTTRSPSAKKSGRRGVANTLQAKQQMVVNQDQQLEQLSQSITRSKEQTVSIGTEPSTEEVSLSDENKPSFHGHFADDAPITMPTPALEEPEPTVSTQRVSGDLISPANRTAPSTSHVPDPLDGKLSVATASSVAAPSVLPRGSRIIAAEKKKEAYKEEENEEDEGSMGGLFPESASDSDGTLSELARVATAQSRAGLARDADASERETAIRQIESSVKEVNEMFADFAQLVSAQNEQISTVATNVAQSGEHILAGVHELHAAAEYQKPRSGVFGAVVRGLRSLVGSTAASLPSVLQSSPQKPMHARNAVAVAYDIHDRIQARGGESTRRSERPGAPAGTPAATAIAHAARTGAVTASTATYADVRRGQLVVIDGKPCQVIETRQSKTGKHGSAKVNVVGVDETGKRIEKIANMREPLEIAAEGMDDSSADFADRMVVSIVERLIALQTAEGYWQFVRDGNKDALAAVIGVTAEQCRDVLVSAGIKSLGNTALVIAMKMMATALVLMFVKLKGVEEDEEAEGLLEQWTNSVVEAHKWLKHIERELPLVPHRLELGANWMDWAESFLKGIATAPPVDNKTTPPNEEQLTTDDVLPPEFEY